MEGYVTKNEFKKNKNNKLDNGLNHLQNKVSKKIQQLHQRRA